jgi:hypothetical protein
MDIADCDVDVAIVPSVSNVINLVDGLPEPSWHQKRQGGSVRCPFNLQNGTSIFVGSPFASKRSINCSSKPI